MEKGASQYEVDVFLNTNTTQNPNFTFENTTGMDLIRTTLTNFTYFDNVWVGDKPRPDAQNDSGIKVQAGGGGTLKITAGPHDNEIRLIESTATSATVEAKSGFAETNYSRFGAGVDKLIIQTDPNGGAIVEVATVQPDLLPDLPGLAEETSLRIESLGPSDEIYLGGSDDASVEAVVRTGEGDNLVRLQQDINGDGITTAVVDFDPSLGGLGSENRLEIGPKYGPNCTAILAPAEGTAPHEVTVDFVWVANGFTLVPGPGVEPPTLIVADDAKIGWLQVNPDDFDIGLIPQAFVNAPLTVPAPAGGLTNGKLFASGRVDFTEVAGPPVVHVIHEFAVDGPVASSEGVVNIESNANVTALTTSQIGELKFPGATNTGKFTLQPRENEPPSAVPRVLTVRSLSMGSTVGQLDITNGGMIVNYATAGPSPLADIRSYITSGYNGGAWTGNGIRSSTAANSAVGDGVGYAERTQVASTFPDTFFGQSIDDTSVLLRYAYYGDVNLGGVVNLQDFNVLAANFGESNRDWVHGDSSYDRLINLVDFNRLAANFGQSTLGPEEDEGGEGFGGGEEYTYDELLAILMELNPEDF